VAARPEAWVCGRSFAGIAVSNPAEGMDICPLWALSVVRWRFLRRADHWSREVLPSVVCLNVVVKPRQRGVPGQLWAVAPGINKMFLTSNISVSYLLYVRQLTFLYSIVTSSHWPMSIGNSVTCFRTSVIPYNPIYHWYLSSSSQLYIYISYKILYPTKR
jgi:hypothetical protein